MRRDHLSLKRTCLMIKNDQESILRSAFANRPRIEKRGRTFQMVSGVSAFRKTDSDWDCRASLSRTRGSAAHEPKCNPSGGVGQTRRPVRSCSLCQVRFFHGDEAN